MTCANVKQRQAVLLGTKNIALMIVFLLSPKAKAGLAVVGFLEAVTSFPCHEMS